MKKLIAILFAAALISGAVGCTELDTDSPTGDSDATGEDVASTDTLAEDTDATVAYETTDPTLTVWDRSGTIWVEVTQTITNSGTTDLYLSGGKFDIEDSSGSLVETYDMASIVPMVIEPGETAYFYGCTTADHITDPSGTYTAIPGFDVAEAKIERVRFPVTDVSMSDESIGTYIDIIGRVENTSDEDESMCNVYLVLFDADGAVIDIESTYVDVAAGEKASFDTSTIASPRGITTADIGSYQAYAYPLDFQF